MTRSQGGSGPDAFPPDDLAVLRREAMKRIFEATRNGNSGTVAWSTIGDGIRWGTTMLAAWTSESWRLFGLENQQLQDAGLRPRVRKPPRFLVEGIFNVTQNLPEHLPALAASFERLGLKWNRPGTLCARCRGPSAP